jgi:hypothetical protein
LTPMSAQASDRSEVRPWKAIAGVCHYECPPDYQVDRNNASHCLRCSGYCPKSKYYHI